MGLAVKKVPLFEGLSGDDLKDLESCLREKDFKKGEILFMEGKICERIFIVREGRVKIYRTASNGREQILEILNGGDTCACNPGVMKWSCSSTGEAVTDSKVWFLSRHDYVRIVQTNGKVAQALNHLFAEKLKCLNNLVEDISLKDAKKRVAKFLLDMMRDNTAQEEGLLTISFTREEIAQRLGTARETVARHLSQLQKSGLIEIRPQQIVILDESGLEQAAE